MNARDTSMVLAALRLWQKIYAFENVKEAFYDIATDDGTHALFTIDEIDELCEEVNCGVTCFDLDQAEQLADVRSLREAREDVLHRAGLLEGEAECLKGEIEDITGRPEPSAVQMEGDRITKLEMWLQNIVLRKERAAMLKVRDVSQWPQWTKIDQDALDRVEADIMEIAGGER
jgi:hypothetical protein